MPIPNADAIVQLWDRARTSLWFVPGLMAFAALTLAILTPLIDRWTSDELTSSLPLVFSGSPVSARAVLTTIGTSMATIAGVVFSMTIVTLQLASSQFGPRLLRTFLRDTANQVVLGTFLGTFLYCVVVLPTVTSGDDSVFVPHVSITIAICFGVISLAMLVYFIDHLAQSIHADAVVLAVSRELTSAIDHLFPESIGEGAEAGAERSEWSPPDEQSRAIEAASAGYLRFINGDAVLEMARERNLVVRMVVEPGRYIFEKGRIAEVWPAPSVDEDVEKAIRRAVVLGTHRTTLQDVAFGFEQLTEMATKALSPAINDRTTAVHCVDRIGSGLSRIVTRQWPAAARRDQDGNVRIITDPVGLGQLLEGAIDPIARNAGVHLTVWLRLLDVLELCAERAIRERDREVIREHARSVIARARGQIESQGDLDRLLGRL